MTGYFKRFGDFCAGFSIFAALLFLFRQFMIFRPAAEDAEGMGAKLILFFSEKAPREYRLYVILIALLLLSLTLSALLKKLPSVTFAVSLLPLCFTVFLFAGGRLYERPAVYLILAILHTASQLFACIDSDRQDRGRRAAFGTDLASLFLTALCVGILLRAPFVTRHVWSELSLFEKQMYDPLLRGDSLWVFGACALAYAILALLRFLWRDLYFLDAALSFLPAIALVYWWCAEKIPFHGALLATLSVLCFLSRLGIMLLCKPKIPNDGNN